MVIFYYSIDLLCFKFSIWLRFLKYNFNSLLSFIIYYNYSSEPLNIFRTTALKSLTIQMFMSPQASFNCFFCLFVCFPLLTMVQEKLVVTGHIFFLFHFMPGFFSFYTTHFGRHIIEILDFSYFPLKMIQFYSRGSGSNWIQTPSSLFSEMSSWWNFVLVHSAFCYFSLGPIISQIFDQNS